jgi:dTMP kinase
MKKNLFIAFEGIDGSGKSTQVKLLAQRLIDNGHKVYSTFEPTDNPVGSMIRNIFKGRITADHKTIAGLFIADRLDHLLNEVNGIVKKLEEGYTVITDRYYFSSYAYHGTHMKMDWVIQANELSAEILRPDLNIFIDVTPEMSMKRINENRSIMDLYETVENLHAVRKKYFEAFNKLKDKERVTVIDGNRPIETISQDIWLNIEEIFKLERSYA